jgi:hypothetical protein
LQVVRGKPGTNGRSIEVELLAGPIVRASPPGLRGDALLLDSGHEVYLVYSDREGWASYQVYGD